MNLIDEFKWEALEPIKSDKVNNQDAVEGISSFINGIINNKVAYVETYNISIRFLNTKKITLNNKLNKKIYCKKCSMNQNHTIIIKNDVKIHNLNNIKLFNKLSSIYNKNKAIKYANNYLKNIFNCTFWDFTCNKCDNQFSIEFFDDELIEYRIYDKSNFSKFKEYLTTIEYNILEEIEKNKSIGNNLSVMILFRNLLESIFKRLTEKDKFKSSLDHISKISKEFHKYDWMYKTNEEDIKELKSFLKNFYSKNKEHDISLFNKNISNSELANKIINNIKGNNLEDKIKEVISNYELKNNSKILLKFDLSEIRNLNDYLSKFVHNNLIYEEYINFGIEDVWKVENKVYKILNILKEYDKRPD
jgi:hypothetical protein